MVKNTRSFKISICEIRYRKINILQIEYSNRVGQLLNILFSLHKNIHVQNPGKYKGKEFIEFCEKSRGFTDLVVRDSI